MLGFGERPAYGKYSYLEKFDYWAVFWGMIMMVGTGFVLWFPGLLRQVRAPLGSDLGPDHPRRGGHAGPALPLRGALLQRAPEALDLPDELGLADREMSHAMLEEEHRGQYEELTGKKKDPHP